MAFQPQVVVITGAAGSMGRKLVAHWQHKYQLRLLDRLAAEVPGFHQADLSHWGPWVEDFRGADLVVHLAAIAEAHRDWYELLGPNVDALIHVFHAAVEYGVRRVVFASSNHVVGGYQDQPDVVLADSIPPRPGLRYRLQGQSWRSDAYAAAKLFGERLGYCLAESHGMQTIAIRFGWMWRYGPNEPKYLPKDCDDWFRLMWLSDRDYLQLMDCCATADLSEPFVVVNGVSRNRGMRWDLEPGRRLGYEPVDDIFEYL